MNDEFFITNDEDGFISSLDQYGKMITKYGQPGKDGRQFLIPHAIAVSPDKKLFVAEAINWRVQSFQIQ